MSWWKKFWKVIERIVFGKPDPDPDPQPDPDPDPDNPEWTNVAVGLRIRLKTYKPDENGNTYKDRRTSIKIDSDFHRKFGMTGENTKVTIDDVVLEYYGVDSENGKHDLAYCSKVMFAKDYNKPCILRLSKDGKLHTVVRINKYEYTTVYVIYAVKDAI
jgi:hypothetical protein